MAEADEQMLSGVPAPQARDGNGHPDQRRGQSRRHPARTTRTSGGYHDDPPFFAVLEQAQAE
jgi:hypothetical protein